MEKRMLWLVGHQDFAEVWVEAPDWPQATVEAAKIWDVPWGKVAAECFEVQKKALLGGVCARCGRFYNSRPPLCEVCRRTQETEARRDRQKLGAFYRRADREWRKSV